MINLREPTADHECSTKKYADETFVRDGYEAIFKAYSLTELAAALSDIDANSQ